MAMTPSGKELEAIQDNCYTGVTTKNIQLFSPTDDSSELMAFKQKKHQSSDINVI